MRAFNGRRTATTGDEVWLVEHPPVYTLGRAASLQHVHRSGDIEVVRTERGGQVTYHGPGQAICYLLVDLRRRHLGARAFIETIESATIDFLLGHGIDAVRRPGAPGVYVRSSDGRTDHGGLAKIASIGVRISSGYSWHGVALNVAMDLEPFSRIDPCGYPGLPITDVKTCLDALPGSRGNANLENIPIGFARHLADRIGRSRSSP